MTVGSLSMTLLGHSKQCFSSLKKIPSVPGIQVLPAVEGNKALFFQLVLSQVS